MSRSIVRVFVVFIILLSASMPTTRAQEQASAPSMETAAQLFRDGDWEKAATAYQAIIRQDVKNGRAWFQLGICMHKLGVYSEAIAAYEEVEDLKFAPQLTRYNLARAYARLNDADRAFGWLELAIEAGYGNVLSLQNDSDLVSIRADERFAAIVEMADKQSRPCENDPAYALLDFWVGEWEVVDAQGKVVGTNIIERILNGCAVTERWSGGLGFEGRSLFYYNNVAGRWTQIWITGMATAPGGMKEKYLVAMYADGGVRFQGEYPSATGASILDRTTLTPLSDGRVRQVIERSNDGGNSWIVGFDAYYVSKK